MKGDKGNASTKRYYDVETGQPEDPHCDGSSRDGAERDSRGIWCPSKHCLYHAPWVLHKTQVHRCGGPGAACSGDRSDRG